MSPLGSDEPVPLKATVSGAGPLVGLAVASAVGAWLPLAPQVIRALAQSAWS